jgi:hypothetical protein
VGCRWPEQRAGWRAAKRMRANKTRLSYFACPVIFVRGGTLVFSRKTAVIHCVRQSNAAFLHDCKVQHCSHRTLKSYWSNNQVPRKNFRVDPPRRTRFRRFSPRPPCADPRPEATVRGPNCPQSFMECTQSPRTVDGEGGARSSILGRLFGKGAVAWGLACTDASQKPSLIH